MRVVISMSRWCLKGGEGSLDLRCFENTKTQRDCCGLIGLQTWVGGVVFDGNLPLLW